MKHFKNAFNIICILLNILSHAFVLDDFSDTNTEDAELTCGSEIPNISRTDMSFSNIQFLSHRSDKNIVRQADITSCLTFSYQFDPTYYFNFELYPLLKINFLNKSSIPIQGHIKLTTSHRTDRIFPINNFEEVVNLPKLYAAINNNDHNNSQTLYNGINAHKSQILYSYINAENNDFNEYSSQIMSMEININNTQNHYSITSIEFEPLPEPFSIITLGAGSIMRSIYRRKKLIGKSKE